VFLYSSAAFGQLEATHTLTSVL